MRAFDQTHRVIDNVHTLATRDLEHFLLPVRLGVVHGEVGTSVSLRHVELRLRAGRCNNLGAKRC